MKLPAKKSRARAVLESMLSGPVTVHQGIERHGEMGVSEGAMRHIYVSLETDGCCIRKGMTFTASEKARSMLCPAQPSAKPVGEVVAPRYCADWRSSTLSTVSAQRAGAAFGLDWIRP